MGVVVRLLSFDVRLWRIGVPSCVVMLMLSESVVRTWGETTSNVDVSSIRVRWRWAYKKHDRVLNNNDYQT